MADSLDLFAKKFLNKNKQNKNNIDLSTQQFNEIDSVSVINKILNKGLCGLFLKDYHSLDQNIDNDIKQYCARISFQFKGETYEMSLKINKKSNLGQFF